MATAITSTYSVPVSFSFPPSRGDWESIKPIFTELYIDQEKELKDVMAILDKEYGFRATIKMYKTRITVWNLRRSLNHAEVLQVIAMTERRRAQGKQTVVMLRGRPVDLEKVIRHQRRKHIRTSDALALYSSTPLRCDGDLRCMSPPPSNLSLSILSAEERLVYEFRALFRGLLDAGFCIPSKTGLQFNEPMLLARQSTEKAWLHVGGCFVGFPEELGRGSNLLRRFSHIVQLSFFSYDVSLWMRLIEEIVLLVLQGHSDAAQYVLNNLRWRSANWTAMPTPQAHFVNALAHMDPDSLSQYWTVLWQVRADVETPLAADMPTLSFETRSRLLKTSKFLHLHVGDEQIVSLLHEGIEYFGIYSYKTMQALLDYYVLTSSSCADAKAEELLDHYLHDVPWKSSSNGILLGGTFMSYHEAHVLGNLYLATNSFLLAMDLFLAMLECSDVYCPRLEQLYILARKVDWLYENHLRQDDRDEDLACNHYRKIARSIENIWRENHESKL